jgi:hypothetical protein
MGKMFCFEGDMEHRLVAKVDLSVLQVHMLQVDGRSLG